MLQVLALSTFALIRSTSLAPSCTALRSGALRVARVHFFSVHKQQGQHARSMGDFRRVCALSWVPAASWRQLALHAFRSLAILRPLRMHVGEFVGVQLTSGGQITSTDSCALLVPMSFFGAPSPASTRWASSRATAVGSAVAHLRKHQQLLATSKARQGTGASRSCSILIPTDALAQPAAQQGPGTHGKCSILTCWSASALSLPALSLPFWRAQLSASTARNF